MDSFSVYVACDVGVQNAASQTLEGLRKETRAGLEYALQNHKTIDIQMDMNAPIIIVPERLAPLFIRIYPSSSFRAGTDSG